MVELQPITKDNVKAVFDLRVAPEQERYVAPNPWSLAQALAEQDVAWPRVIVASGDVVGFLMLEIDLADEDGQPYWLWRLMVDAAHQNRGYGRAALELAIDELRGRGAGELFTSWVPGEAGPEVFYLQLGFVPTGEIDDGEIVARLAL